MSSMGLIETVLFFIPLTRSNVSLILLDIGGVSSTIDPDEKGERMEAETEKKNVRSRRGREGGGGVVDP